MILSETIPTIVTWQEIKDHCRLDDDTERVKLESFALAAVQAFERETSVAVGTRTITATYSHDDTQHCYAHPYLSHSPRNNLDLAKAPVISITSISDGQRTLTQSEYEVRQQGKTWYVHLYNNLNRPLTLTYVAGFSVVPALIKQGVLILTEHWRLNRGVTTSLQQYVVSNGLERICNLYSSNRALVG